MRLAHFSLRNNLTNISNYLELCINRNTLARRFKEAFSVVKDMQQDKLCEVIYLDDAILGTHDRISVVRGTHCLYTDTTHFSAALSIEISKHIMPTLRRILSPYYMDSGIDCR
jgi:hypothetical protein